MSREKPKDGEVDLGGSVYPSATDLRYHLGMSLRDLIALKALGWILPDPGAWDDYEDMAKSTYAIADAMLRARKTQP